MFVSVIFYISRLVPNILTEQTLSYLAIFPGGTVLLPPCRPHRMFVGDVPRRPQCHLPVGNSSKPYLVEGAWGSNLRDNPGSLCKGATVEHVAADVKTSPKGPRSCPGTPSVDSVLALRACEHLVVGPPIRFRPSVITDGALTHSSAQASLLLLYQMPTHPSQTLHSLCYMSWSSGLSTLCYLLSDSISTLRHRLWSPRSLLHKLRSSCSTRNPVIIVGALTLSSVFTSLLSLQDIWQTWTGPSTIELL